MTAAGAGERDDPFIIDSSSDEDAPRPPPPQQRPRQPATPSRPNKGKGRARPVDSDSDTGIMPPFSRRIRGSDDEEPSVPAQPVASSSRVTATSTSPTVKVSHSQRGTPRSPKKRKKSESPVSPSKSRQSGINDYFQTSSRANGEPAPKRRATGTQPEASVPRNKKMSVAELSRRLEAESGSGLTPRSTGGPSRNRGADGRSRPNSDSASRPTSTMAPPDRPSLRASNNHAANQASGSGNTSSSSDATNPFAARKESPPPRNIAPERAIVSDDTPGSWSNPSPLVATRTRRTASPSGSAAQRGTASPAQRPRSRPSSGTWENPEPMTTPALPASSTQRPSSSRRPASRDSSGTWAQPEPLVVNTGRRNARPQETDSSGVETEDAPRPKPTKARKTGGGKAPRRMPPLPPSSQDEPPSHPRPAPPATPQRAPKWATSAAPAPVIPSPVITRAAPAVNRSVSPERPADTGEPYIGDDLAEDIVVQQQQSSPNANPPEEDSSDPLAALDEEEEDLSLLEGSGDELLEPPRARASPSPSPSRLEWLDSDGDSGLDMFGNEDEGGRSAVNGSRGQPSTGARSSESAVGASTSSRNHASASARPTSRSNGTAPQTNLTEADKATVFREELRRMRAPPVPVVNGQSRRNGLTNGRHIRFSDSPSPEPERIDVNMTEYRELLKSATARHYEGHHDHISLGTPGVPKTPFAGLREAQTSPVDDEPPAGRRGIAKRSLGVPRVHDIQRAAAYLASRPELFCSIIEAMISVATSGDEHGAPEIKVVNAEDAVGSPPPTNYEYSNEMLYSEAIPDPELGKGCDCEGVCDPNSQTCSCAARQQLYFYNLGPTGFQWDDNERIKHPDCTIWECGPNCGCPPECGNRVIQRGRQKNADVSIFKTEKKGWGVRARGIIERGTFLGIYSGELITDAESERRASELYDQIGTTYLFDLDGYHLTNPPEGLEDIDPRAYELARMVKQRADASGSDDGKYSAYSVDAFHYGYTRFINHSCEPNVVITQAYVKDFHPERPLLVMIARYDIFEGEELCISYKGTKDDEPAPLLPEALRERSETPARRGQGSKSTTVHVSPRRPAEQKVHRCLCCNGNMFSWD
ncbi:Histone-lysine N-methyltransferase, H3 lysine-9 specific [Vanrija pseudolonga]|uniref:Histone-lysine N-methyltransferase, H3 lysine-9 specific n=1 Tax=Vanrija pseudolonga TaxID=143232 RepID=A0AAF1BLF2_9TREE|nr:Histone-lysine N-methyltransferase, H3 lysine-9 specific [Vanrija pseudolonga]